MKNKFKFFGIIVLVAVMVSFAGCVTASSIGGTTEGHGLFTFNVNPVTEGFTEVGYYMVILGLVDAGYGDFAVKVKEAADQGKQITSVTKDYYLFAITTAYAK